MELIAFRLEALRLAIGVAGEGANPDNIIAVARKFIALALDDSVLSIDAAPAVDIVPALAPAPAV